VNPDRLLGEGQGRGSAPRARAAAANGTPFRHTRTARAAPGHVAARRVPRGSDRRHPAPAAGPGSAAAHRGDGPAGGPPDGPPPDAPPPGAPATVAELRDYALLAAAAGDPGAGPGGGGGVVAGPGELAALFLPDGPRPPGSHPLRGTAWPKAREGALLLPPGAGIRREALRYLGVAASGPGLLDGVADPGARRAVEGAAARAAAAAAARRAATGARALGGELAAAARGGARARPGPPRPRQPRQPRQPS